jgi:hypothetical protein
MADILQDEAKFTSWDFIHYDREAALLLVDIFLESGWSPR